MLSGMTTRKTSSNSIYAVLLSGGSPDNACRHRLQR